MALAFVHTFKKRRSGAAAQRTLERRSSILLKAELNIYIISLCVLGARRGRETIAFFAKCAKTDGCYKLNLLQKALFLQRYVSLAETAVFGGGKAEAFDDWAGFQVILNALLQNAVAFAVHN